MEPGQIVDRYEVLGELGRGGHATVYAVRHRHLGTEHALKVVNKAGAARVAALVREGRLQAHLDPAHVLPVQDVLEIGDTKGLLVPLVRGGSLSDALSIHRPSAEDAEVTFRAIALGVRSIHAAGIAHCDLKPGNVMLDLRGDWVVPLVADFGIAMPLDATWRGIRGGTPGYSAPELWGDGPVDHRVDLWSLGMLLVELFTGRPPPAEGPPRLDDLPESWRALAGWCLADDPNHRPPSIEALRTRFPPMETKDRALSVFDGWGKAIRSQARPAPAIGSAAATTQGEFFVTEAPPLPTWPDAFHGREAECAALHEALRPSSAVWVIGLRGVGKTRLVAEVLAKPTSSEARSVWFADLRDVEDVSGLVRAVGSAMLLDDAGPPQIGRALALRGDGVLVLDGWGLGDVANELLAEWIQVFAGQIVGTSRLRCPVDGVTHLPVGGLEREAAEALFWDRARVGRPDFEPRPRDLEALPDLLAALDHLPLAVE
ncbi:MAG: protein kinase, partial [Myxococcota bacterium]